MKQPELFRGTNWEFNPGFKRKWKNCQKKPSMVPLYWAWTAPSTIGRLKMSVHSKGNCEAQRGNISNPQIHYSFSGLSHAGLSGLPHYISSAHYLTAGRLFFHGTSLPTLNIFIIPLCVADELLWLCFYYWAECKRSDGDRKDERKQSKQFSSPASSRLQD